MSGGCVGCGELELVLETQDQQIKRLTGAADRRRLLDSIEVSGQEASEQGRADADCPHPLDTPEWTVWMKGWSYNELLKARAETTSTLHWSLEALQTTSEIAGGLGQGEIVDKLRTISERLQKEVDR